MAKRLDFRPRPPRERTRAGGTLRLDLSTIAADVAQEQAIHERLRRAVRSAIEAELAAIQAERERDPTS